jgi:glutathione S-transferase
LKFYCNSTSPFVRKVAVTIRELGLDGKIERVVTNPRDATSGFWGKNPLAKIPAFETDDGAILYDSPVICAYLDEVHGGGKLAPRSGAARWRTLTLAALADGILDAGLLARLETLRPAEEQSRSWIDKQMAIVQRGFDRLEANGDAFSAVDHASIAAGCAVAWVRFRHAQTDWLGARPRLATWFKSFEARPSMTATKPVAA